MNAILAVFGMGGTELLVILAAVLVLFGARKIPEFAKGLGQGIKEFKKASREVTDELQRAAEEEPAPPLKKISAPATAENTVPASETYPAPKA